MYLPLPKPAVRPLARSVCARFGRDARNAGSDSEHQRRYQRNAERECENDRIDADVGRRAADSPERCEATARFRAARKQSERRAGQREHNTLGEHLRDERVPTAAERRADGELAVARGSADEQQVRDVGAGDEQHEHHRAHQREDGGTNFLDDVRGHGLRAPHGVRRLENDSVDSGPHVLAVLPVKYRVQAFFDHNGIIQRLQLPV